LINVVETMSQPRHHLHESLYFMGQGTFGQVIEEETNIIAKIHVTSMLLRLFTTKSLIHP